MLFVVLLESVVIGSSFTRQRQYCSCHFIFLIPSDR